MNINLFDNPEFHFTAAVLLGTIQTRLDSCRASLLPNLHGKLTKEVEGVEKFAKNFLLTKDAPSLGFFYKIKGPGGETRGYLLGTCHGLKNYLDVPITFDEKINRALAKSAFLALERTEHFTADNFQELEKTFNETQFMDRQLECRAYRSGIERIDLETAQEQEQALEYVKFHPQDNIEKRAYQRLIQSTKVMQTVHRVLNYRRETAISMEALKALASHNPAIFISYVKYVRSGIGSEILAKQIFKITLDKQCRRIIFTDRNQIMNKRIAQLLIENPFERFFIAVGADHLIGNKGIPALLNRQSHFTVKKIGLSLEDFLLHGDDRIYNISATFTAKDMIEESAFEDPLARASALINLAKTMVLRYAEIDKAIAIWDIILLTWPNTYTSQFTLFVDDLANLDLRKTIDFIKRLPGSEKCRNEALCQIAIYFIKKDRWYSALDIIASCDDCDSGFYKIILSISKDITKNHVDKALTIIQRIKNKATQDEALEELACKVAKESALDIVKRIKSPRTAMRALVRIGKKLDIDSVLVIVDLMEAHKNQLKNKWVQTIQDQLLEHMMKTKANGDETIVIKAKLKKVNPWGIWDLNRDAEEECHRWLRMDD